MDKNSVMCKADGSDCNELKCNSKGAGISAPFEFFVNILKNGF